MKIKNSFQTFLALLGTTFSFSFLTADSPYSHKPRDYSPPDSVPQTSWMYMVDIQKFQRKWKKPPPEWMLRGIRKELAPFYSKKITQEALHETFQQVHPLSYTRYRIFHNKIYRSGPDLFGLDSYFRTLGRLADYPGVPDLPDIDFILGQRDGVPMNYDPPDYWITPDFQDQAPIFAFARSESAPYVVCVPDAFTIAEWKKLSQEILANNSLYPWSAKEKKAFWRGQPSDFLRALPPHLLLETYSSQPRCILCALSLLYPEEIDAGFNAPGPSPTYLWEKFQPYTKTGVFPEKHLRYAYLPVLDGAMCTFPGYLWRLLSNSVTFKHPGGVQWFYEGLEPYVHYIPIDYRLENLLDQLNWAKFHDNECQKIAENATHFVLENVMMEDIYLYQMLVFLEYAKCQAFDGSHLRYTKKESQWTRIR